MLVHRIQLEANSKSIYDNYLLSPFITLSYKGVQYRKIDITSIVISRKVKTP